MRQPNKLSQQELQDEESIQDGRKEFALSENFNIRKTFKTLVTPKRKHFTEGSPRKKRKINFEENLNFWRALSDNQEQTHVLMNKEFLPRNSDMWQPTDQWSGDSAEQWK